MKPRIKPLGLCLLAVLILLPIITAAQVVYHPDAGTISIQPEGRLLSAILSDISIETGVDIYINPDIDKPIFVKIERQPLETALKRLIRPLNNVLLFEGDTLTAIKIFKESNSESTIKLSSDTIHQQAKAQASHQAHQRKNKPNTEPNHIDPNSIPPSTLPQAIRDGRLTRESLFAFMTDKQRRELPPHIFSIAFQEGLITQEELADFLPTEQLESDFQPTEENQGEDLQATAASGDERPLAEQEKLTSLHRIQRDFEDGRLTTQEFEALMEGVEK